MGKKTAMPTAVLGDLLCLLRPEDPREVIKRLFPSIHFEGFSLVSLSKVVAYLQTSRTAIDYFQIAIGAGLGHEVTRNILICLERAGLVHVTRPGARKMNLYRLAD